MIEPIKHRVLDYLKLHLMVRFFDAVLIHIQNIVQPCIFLFYLSYRSLRSLSEDGEMFTDIMLWYVGNNLSTKLGCKNTLKFERIMGKKSYHIRVLSLIYYLKNTLNPHKIIFMHETIKYYPLVMNISASIVVMDSKNPFRFSV